MSIPERRKARRVALELPIKVRLWESAVPEQKVECLNISERGLYFASGTRFNAGERLELVLKMPEDIVGRENSNWLCVGQVVRTMRSTLLPWRLGWLWSLNLTSLRGNGWMAAPILFPANLQLLKRARRRRDDLSVAGQPPHLLPFVYQGFVG